MRIGNPCSGSAKHRLSHCSALLATAKAAALSFRSQHRLEPVLAARRSATTSAGEPEFCKLAQLLSPLPYRSKVELCR
jgi:hypothetical protein